MRCDKLWKVKQSYLIKSLGLRNISWETGMIYNLFHLNYIVDIKLLLCNFFILYHCCKQVRQRTWQTTFWRQRWTLCVSRPEYGSILVSSDIHLLSNICQNSYFIMLLPRVIRDFIYLYSYRCDEFIINDTKAGKIESYRATLRNNEERR